MLILFTVESFFKIVATGFWMGKRTYLVYCTNGWNMLDFTVVVFGWLAGRLVVVLLHCVR